MKLFKQSVRLEKITFIVGDGPEKNLLKYIKSLNLEKIKLIGFEKDPIKYLAKADLYINSSYFEVSESAVEQLIGLLIIASQSHGINEILSGGKGGTYIKIKRN